MPSLLKQAIDLKKSRRNRVAWKTDRVPVTSQEKDLLLGWLNGDIGFREIVLVMGRRGHNAYSRAFVIMRRMFEEGRIIVKK